MTCNGILRPLSIALLLLLPSCSPQDQLVQSTGNSHINVTSTANDEIPFHIKTVDPKTVDYFAHIRSEHREVLRTWLKKVPYLRPGVEEIDGIMFQEENYQDKVRMKENFEGEMTNLRESVGSHGYQYYAVGDMNHDGKKDFAVLLVDTRKQKDGNDRFALAIFNAPFKSGQSPAYIEKGLIGISNSYITFDVMEKNHLYLGKFESDVYCATYYTKGKTYYFKDCM